VSVVAPERLLSKVAGIGAGSGDGAVPRTCPRSHSQTALGWVLPGLDELLAEARAELEDFVYGGQVEAPCIACAQLLHRVCGSLEMIEQYALSLLAGEMEALSLELPAKNSMEAEEGAELLMRGILELDDHLQLLASGCPEVPAQLLPVLNDLRAVRSQPLLSESALFNPDLSAELPVEGVRSELTQARLKAHARQLRGYLQRGLLGWHRGKARSQGLGLVEAVVGRLQKLASGTPYFRLWWVTAALFEALAQEGLSSEPALRRVLRALDGELGRLGEQGLAVLEAEPPPRLLKNVLYYVARATSAGAKVNAAKLAFGLQNTLVGVGDNAFGGPDLGAYRAVAQVVREELATVRDGFDALCRNPESGPYWIPALTNKLKRLSDALAMLNLGPTHKRLAALANQFEGFGQEDRIPRDEILMGAAAELLSIDSTLAILAKGGITQEEATPVVSVAESGMSFSALPPEEVWQLDVAVVREVVAELARAKTVFTERSAGRPSATGKQFDAHIRRAAGALSMLDRSDAAKTVQEWGAIMGRVLAAPAMVTDLSLLNELAEVIEALQYCVESEVGIALGERDVQSVGLWLKNLTTQVESLRDSGTALFPVDAAPDAKAAVPQGEVDDDILAIFLEEAEEAVSTLKTHMERWQDNPDDRDSLVTVRRAFHTLKGSGRMVGATAIGDFAWSLENLFNRILDGLCPVTGDMLAIARDGADGLPELISSFKSGVPLSFDVADFAKRVAQALDKATGRVSPVARGRADSGVESPERASMATTVIEPSVDKVAEPDRIYGGNAPFPRDLITAQRDPATESGQPIDEDLVDLDDPRQVFQSEAAEILDLIDVLLNHWREAPQDRGCVTALQRELHTLKGGARICNITPMGDLSHQIENVLVLVMEGQLNVSGRLISLVERCHDRLAEMLEAVRAEQVPRSGEDLEQQLDDFVSATSPTEGTPVAAELDSRGMSGSTDGVAPAVSRNRAVLGGGSSNVVLGRGDRIQVPSAYLDSLAGYAGEINISQARMGQQVGSFRHNLEEMEQTILRLRDQLRRLELEADSALPAPTRDHAKPTDDFDALELDRYSRVQQLSRGLAESLSDLESIRELMDGIAGESSAILSEQARVSRDLHQGLLRTRMLSISGLVQRFRRLVRRTMTEVGKRVELQVEGGDIQLDRAVLDLLTPSLEHMLRNAVDHGIESPDDRLAIGKAATGTVSLSFARVGAEMEIRVEDDGRGLDLDAMLQTARQRGLVSTDVVPDREELMRMVLEPGFSTAREVTQLSGRGVGLDVVNADVKQLGGTLHIQSRKDEGCHFIIRVPFTLALNQVILVEADGEALALPLANVDAVLRIPAQELRALDAHPAPDYEYQGQSYALVNLGTALGMVESQRRELAEAYPVVLVKAGETRVALTVDDLAGRQEIAVKPLVPPLIGVRWVTGATILADGQVALILDVPALIRRCLSLHGSESEAIPPAPEAGPGPDRALTVMVVDDSITVRRVTQRVLERHGLAVMTAKDGMEAFGALEEKLPDLILLDIEMPQMDGFQLAEKIRQDAAKSHLPILMISSRTGMKHSERASDLRVQGLLGKPYQESELLERIGKILERPIGDG